MRQLARGIIGASALLLMPTMRSLQAQEGEPATIPTALAFALAGPFFPMFEERPRFVVARTPDGWPAALAPAAPARVVGGVTFGPFRSVVYRYPRRVNAVEAYQQMLAHAGFTRVGPETPHGGFTSVATPEIMPYCGPDGSVRVGTVDSSATTRTIVVLFASQQAGMSACAPRPESASDRKMPLKLPPLVAPVGVSAVAEGSNWSTDRLATSVQLDSLVSADSLLAHYAGQLEAAGWQVGKRLIDGGTAMQTLSVHDADGKAWSGALIVTIAGDRRTVSLSMFRASSE